MSNERPLGDRYRRLFDGGPLDDTYLGRRIARSPEGRRANADARMRDWREDLKARVRARLKGS